MEIARQVFDNSILPHIKQEQLDGQEKLMMYLLNEYVNQIGNDPIHINIFSLVVNNNFRTHDDKDNLATLIVHSAGETANLLNIKLIEN